MRSARWLWCSTAAGAGGGGAAAAAPSPLSTDSSSGNSKDGDQTDKGKDAAAPPPPPPPMGFRPLTLQPWQTFAIALDHPNPALRSSSTSSSVEAASADLTALAKTAVADRLGRLPSSPLLYHGTRLGPRPLIILDHSVPFTAEAAELRRTALLLAQARTVGKEGEDGSTTTMMTDGDSGFDGAAVKRNTAAALAAMSGGGGGVSDAALRSAQKYESMLSHLRWEHGVVYIPMHVPVTSGGGGGTNSDNSNEESLLQVSCRQVIAVLDALSIEWAHFLTYGYGTLVAGRLAASALYPHRIGSFLSLDTPLVTAAMMRNGRLREELAAASEDVNVPAAELAFAADMLCNTEEEESGGDGSSGREGPLPCPASVLAQQLTAATAATVVGGGGGSPSSPSPAATAVYTADLAANDTAVYGGHLFDPSAIFRRGGIERDESRYTPLRALASVQHPFQLIVPSGAGAGGGAVSDVSIHKEVFGIRRPAVIKTAPAHACLFGFPPPPPMVKPAAAAASCSGGEAKGSKKGGKKDVDGAVAAAAPAAFFADAASKEVADTVAAWLNRFEPDVVLARRYEQAAKEMTKLMGSPAGGGEGVDAATGGKKDKKGGTAGKKEKKEKKKKA